MGRKALRRRKRESPYSRRYANANRAGAYRHHALATEWGRGRVGQHEDHGQSPLYHYTSGVGFSGILTSGRFWATHIRDFEDEAELRHAFEIASDLLDSASERTQSRNGKAVLSGTKKALEIFENYFDVYVVSLCERVDLDDMWQRYADQDRGFALEIVPADDPEESLPRDDRPLLLCRKVIYDEDQQVEFFRAIIDRVVGEVEALETTYGELATRKPGKQFMMLLFHCLLDYSAAFKRAVPYATEQEWRYLCVIPHGSKKARTARTRVRAEKTIRYMELDLWAQRHGDLKLQKVFGGLNCSQQQITDAVGQVAVAGREPVPVEIRTPVQAA